MIRRLSLGWCGVHRKSLYPNRKTGWDAIRRLGEAGMRVYPCRSIDGMFHVGHYAGGRLRRVTSRPVGASGGAA